MASFCPAKCIQLRELVLDLNKAMIFGKGTTDWVQKHGLWFYLQGRYIYRRILLK